MIDTSLESFLAGSDETRFPVVFLQKFELMECLSHNELGETLFVKEKQTGEFYVAKCYPDKALLSHSTESDLLKKLNHAGLPKYIGEYKNEKMLCVLRMFAQGKPLDQWVQENPPTPLQSISIILQLCDILNYLHGQTPAVIHRDIKPQNIIVDENGQITLIDFGISRIFNEASKEDTLCFGTRHYAAPEQYGFSQTDCRSDIFSLGVLLCWLLTESEDVQQANNRITDTRLKRIVLKCTAFAPNDRYQSAIQVKKALTVQNDRRKLLAPVMAGLIILTTVLLLINPFGIRNMLTGGIRFREPLVEAAVRMTLNKDTKEVITEQELLLITELYVYGDHAVADSEAFSDYADQFATNAGNVNRGTIDTLVDLKQLKKLRRLSLAYEEISNLTPLAELRSLEEIDLRHNPIDDLSPLSQLPSLTTLILFGTDISDLSSMRDCPRLSLVDVGGTQISSMTAFSGLDTLQTIVIRKAPLQSLEGINELANLERIYLSDTQVKDLSPLLDLSRLQSVEVSDEMREAVKEIEQRAQFQIVFQ